MQESNKRGGRRPGAGRPRRPPTLAAALRSAFPLETLVAMAQKLATSENEDTQRWALAWLSDRGHGKAPDKLEVGPAGSMQQDDDDALVDQLTDAELDALDAIDDERDKLLERAAARLEPIELPASDET